MKTNITKPMSQNCLLWFSFDD